MRDKWHRVYHTISEGLAFICIMIKANSQIIFYAGNNYLQHLCERWFIADGLSASFPSDWWFWTPLVWAVHSDLISDVLWRSALCEIETPLKVPSCAYRKSLLCFAQTPAVAAQSHDHIWARIKETDLQATKMLAGCDCSSAGTIPGCITQYTEEKWHKPRQSKQMSHPSQFLLASLELAAR